MILLATAAALAGEMGVVGRAGNVGRAGLLYWARGESGDKSDLQKGVHQIKIL